MFDTIRLIKHYNKIIKENETPNNEEQVPKFYFSLRECFTSPDAATKYETFRNINENHANFKHVVDLHQQGIGLPLMEAQYKLSLWSGGVKFATIFKYVPPPPGSKRTFNKKTDKFEFCKVLRKREWHHTRYTFVILPNQRNPSDIFTFSMFWHNKLPIIDVSPIRGSPRRYRWIITDPRSYSREDYTYKLYYLEEQKSTVDSMDVTNQKLGKANLNTTSCVFPKDIDHMDKFDKHLMLTKPCFELPYETKYKAARLRRFGEKITMSRLQEDNKLHNVSPPHYVDLESVYSVGVHELAIMCMSFVINLIEDHKYQCEKG